MLGRKAVVDRHHDRVRRVRELAGDDIELLGAADDPPAAVEDHEHGEPGVRRRPVHADRDAVGVAFLDREHRLGLSPCHLEEQPPAPPRRIDALLGRDRDAGRLYHVEDELGLGIERRHGTTSRTR